MLENFLLNYKFIQRKKTHRTAERIESENFIGPQLPPSLPNSSIFQ